MGRYIFTFPQYQPIQDRTDDRRNYEECIFQRIVASEANPHDREPWFMSVYIREFNPITVQNEHAMEAYGTRANETAEHVVQMLTRGLKSMSRMWIKDREDHAVSASFAINTSQDRAREDTPFFFVRN